MFLKNIRNCSDRLEKAKNKNYIEENTLIKLKENGNKNAKNKNIGKHSTKVVGEKNKKVSNKEKRRKV